MKIAPFASTLAFAIALVSIAGCTTLPKATPQTEGPTWFDALCDKFLPADFNGTAQIAERGHWLTVVAEAENLKRMSDGRWTFTYLHYNRTLNLPFFTGLPYQHTGTVTLGMKGQKPVPTSP